MTKTRKRIVNPNQMSLLDYLQQERDVRADQTPGRLNVNARLQAAIREAVKRAPKSRETIADEMTDLVGQGITVHQINNWTAESHPHRIPAELLPAFCMSTGSMEPMRVLAEAAGVFTLPPPDALRADVQKLREQKRDIEGEIRRAELFLKEMER